MNIHNTDQGKLSLGLGGYTCHWGFRICGLYEKPDEQDENIPGFLHLCNQHPDDWLKQNPHFFQHQIK